MSKNEGKQVLSPDTEVNARSIQGLLHPPVLGYQEARVPGVWSNSIDTACHSWGRLPFHERSLAQDRCSANICLMSDSMKSAWCWCQGSNLSLCSEDRRARSSVAWEKRNMFSPGLGDCRPGWGGKAVTIHDHLLQKVPKCVLCVRPSNVWAETVSSWLRIQYLHSRNSAHAWGVNFDKNLTFNQVVMSMVINRCPNALHQEL